MSAKSAKAATEAKQTEARQERSKLHATLLTALVPAVFGVLGGVFSGTVTAWVQLETKREEFDISRADKFTKLLDALVDEKKAGLALLNLWQIYPDEQYRQVIVGTALTIEQAEILEYIGYTDTSRDAYSLSDALYAQALSKNPEIAGEARALLERTDPDRAAELIVGELTDILQRTSGRLPQRKDAELVTRLKLLAENSTSVAALIGAQTAGAHGFFFDYVLYLAGRESQFIPRLVDDLAARRNLDLMVEYTYRSEFREIDGPRVVAAVRNHILDGLNAANRDDFEVAEAVSSLKNFRLNAALSASEDMGFTDRMVEVAASPHYHPVLREAALILLDTYAFRDALKAFVRAQIDAGASGSLGDYAAKFPSQKKIEALVAEDPRVSLPACAADYAACIAEDPETWRAWLNEQG